MRDSRLPLLYVVCSDAGFGNPVWHWVGTDDSVALDEYGSIHWGGAWLTMVISIDGKESSRLLLAKRNQTNAIIGDEPIANLNSDRMRRCLHSAQAWWLNHHLEENAFDPKLWRN